MNTAEELGTQLDQLVGTAWRQQPGPVREAYDAAVEETKQPCWKVCHPDRKTANEHADSLLRQCRLAGDNRTQIAVYRCAICGGWHVGRQNGRYNFGRRK